MLMGGRKCRAPNGVREIERGVGQRSMGVAVMILANANGKSVSSLDACRDLDECGPFGTE